MACMPRIIFHRFFLRQPQISRPRQQPRRLDRLPPPGTSMFLYVHMRVSLQAARPWLADYRSGFHCDLNSSDCVLPGGGRFMTCRGAPAPAPLAVATVPSQLPVSPAASTAVAAPPTASSPVDGAVASALSPSSSSPRPVPAVSAQAAIVARLRAQYKDRGLVVGDAYYAIDAKWLAKWNHASGFTTAMEDAALVAMLAARDAGGVSVEALAVGGGSGGTAEVRSARTMLQYPRRCVCALCGVCHPRGDGCAVVPWCAGRQRRGCGAGN